MAMGGGSLVLTIKDKQRRKKQISARVAMELQGLMGGKTRGGNVPLCYCGNIAMSYDADIQNSKELR